MLVGLWNGTATLKKRQFIMVNNFHILATPFLRSYPRNKHTTNKDLYMKVDSNLIVIGKSWKQPNVHQSGNRWTYCNIATQWNILSNKRNNYPYVQQRLLKKQHAKKPGTKDYTRYDSIYVTFWKRQSYDRKQTSGYQGLGVEGGDWLQKDLKELFEVMEMLCILTGVVAMLLYAFAQTHWATHF